MLTRHESVSWGAPVVNRDTPHAVREASVAYAFPRTRTSRVHTLDELACALRAAADRVVLPLARAAAAFTAAEGWRAFGDVRLEDHARESFGRTARWVRDQVRLHDAVTRFPRLGESLVGADGGAPLGSEKSKLVARAALRDESALEAWIARAREVTVGALRREVRHALQGDDPVAADELEPRARVVIEVPHEIAVAFEETCELARASAGRELGMAGVVEALLAEAEPQVIESACLATNADPRTGAAPALPPPGAGAWIERVDAAPRSVTRARIEAAAALAPIAPADDSDVALRARTTLAEFRELAAAAGRGDAHALHDQLRRLVALEDTIMRRLGEVVGELDDHGAWATLPFTNVADYAERRLGLGATTVEDRVRAARALVRRPLLRAAYDAGRVSLEAAMIALRAMGPRAAAADADIEKAWVERTLEATVKRMRDELRIVRRRPRADAAVGCCPASDEEWSAARRRDPGETRRAVLAAGLAAVLADAERPPEADVFLRLTLPESTAGRFLAALESARRGLTALAESVPWDEPWPHPATLPSLLAARTISTRARRVPAWVGLLALLEDATLTWDDPRATPRRPGDDVYRRAGYRCEAPGCTSRANLHDHHVVFRAHGGGDGLENRIVLCEGHHRALHDAGTLSARGAAPVDVVVVKGRVRRVRFRCERRIDTN